MYLNQAPEASPSPTFCTADTSVLAPWAANGEGPRSGIASATAPDMAPLIIMDRHIDKACGRRGGGAIR